MIWIFIRQIAKSVDHGENSSKYDAMPHQTSIDSAIMDTSDQQSVIIAPCVPIVLGAKRERLRGETVVRRSKKNDIT